MNQPQCGHHHTGKTRHSAQLRSSFPSSGSCLSLERQAQAAKLTVQHFYESIYGRTGNAAGKHGGSPGRSTPQRGNAPCAMLTMWIFRCFNTVFGPEPFHQTQSPSQKEKTIMALANQQLLVLDIGDYHQSVQSSAGIDGQRN